MCDEYYDARKNAFWQALAEADKAAELDDAHDAMFEKPIALQPNEPMKTRPKTLAR